MNKTFARKRRAAEQHLSEACPKIAAWIHESGKCTLEPQWTREPYEALVRAVAHQQLHGKAAEAILGRLTALFPEQDFPTREQLAKMRKAKMRTLGFSEAKSEAILGIAKASLKGIVPTRSAAESLSDEELVERLTSLKGIGKWTVEMFLIFTLGRTDVMPVDDFGVQSGLMHLYQLPEMPKKKAFGPLTDLWRPYRSIGAWYLWRLADARKPKKLTPQD